jgi:hypothetical protein
MNRIALFSSPFELSFVPQLDATGVDLVASQDFDEKFICSRVFGNSLVALKKYQGCLVTWDLDDGNIMTF